MDDQGGSENNRGGMSGLPGPSADLSQGKHLPRLSVI